MSIRPRRALVGLAVAAAALVALPASALAAGETLSISPANLQAGGNPTITATLGFAPSAGDTPKTVVLSTAPGIFANLNANPSCLAGAQQLTSSCQIGTAVVNTSSGNVPGTLYLVPPQNSGDFAGIETVAPPLPSQYTGATLRTTPTVGVDLTTTFPDSRGLVTVNGVTDTLNPTLNGQPFTRLPTSCSAATSTVSVTYYGSTANGSASDSFTPTGCSSLAYAPALTGLINRDKNDSGAELVTEVTQAATESASKTIVLQLPKGLRPNVQAVVGCLNATGCKIGTATATSPLVPSVALANGSVTLSGSATSPSISIAFPAPFGITITGAVSLTTNSVTFANVPDVPLTDLKLDVTGPATGGKAFTTDCAPADVGGNFTAQSGATKTVSSPITFTGCALPPTASGSTKGLASGHPKLTFKITHGQGGGANIAAVTIGLPRGLKFSHSAIISHKTCTTKGKKKKCTTTTLIKGLGIKGGKAKTVAIKGGKLVITLKKATGRLTITVAGPLVAESKSLQTKVKKHKAGSLKFTFKITDAKHKSTTTSLKLRAH